MTTLTTFILPKTKTVRTRLTDGTARVRSHPKFIRPMTPLPDRRTPVNLEIRGHGHTKPLFALLGKPDRKNNRGKP
jgi:hypothetical protein